MSLGTLPRRWRITLIASLALNLLVVGLVAGALLGRGDRGPGMRGQPLIAAFPLAERNALRAEFGQPSRDDRRARFRALLDVIRAEPFDPAALRAILSDERARGSDRAARAEYAIIARLGSMTPEQRTAYADRLIRQVRRGAWRR